MFEGLPGLVKQFVAECGCIGELEGAGQALAIVTQIKERHGAGSSRRAKTKSKILVPHVDLFLNPHVK